VTDWIDRAELAASIYAADFSRLGDQLNSLLEVGARRFHFDIGDGHFVDEITIGPIVLKSIAPLIHRRHGTISCHLMVEKPEQQFERVKTAGADRVCFHFEACAEPTRAIEYARQLSLNVGVAFNPDTPIEEVVPIARSADFVLCMSVHPGLSGQSFLPNSYERIKFLRKALPSSTIAVDGGIHENNIVAVLQAGANVIVVGSAIFWGGNPAIAYRRLRARLDESSVANTA
jgi:ribulose-phosphate 3-epimerase